MEPVIALILLIGAFALGHSTADQGVAETEAPVVRESVIEPWYDDPAPQGCRYRVDGTLQRDLTLPHTHHPSTDRAGSELTGVACCCD